MRRWRQRPVAQAGALLGCALSAVAAAATPGGAGELGFPEIALPPKVDQLAIVNEITPKGRAHYVDLVRREAERQGLPAPVADAVVHVESGYDPGAVGSVGEVGLMQIRPATASMLGFSGAASALFVPETNIRLGVAYLVEAWRLARGDLCAALAKYRAGHGQVGISPRSAAYCSRARMHLAGLGSPLAFASGDASLPGQQFTSGAGRGGLATTERVSTASAKVRALWAQHAARVRQIETRISRAMSGG